MDTHINTAGYELLEIDQDHWALNVKGGPAFVGSFRKVIKHAVSRMGFKFSEIEYAVSQMVAKDHNGAHFGVGCCFLFTFTKEFKNVKQAS